MSTTMSFVCSICEEQSTRICVKCTKDTCANHLCDKCGACSDCCDCEIRLESNHSDFHAVPHHVGPDDAGPHDPEPHPHPMPDPDPAPEPDPLPEVSHGLSDLP